MGERPVNLFEYEARAQASLAQEQFDFIAGGAGDELSIRRARAVFDSILVRGRVLADVSTIDTSTTVLGQPMAAPVLLAPAGFHDRAHPDAEAATARAAATAGLIMVASVNSALTLEDIGLSTSGPKWFQQSLYADRDLTLELAARAQVAGYAALCVTLDSPPYAPRRERDIRNRYRQAGSPNFAATGRSGVDRAATWDDLAAFVARAAVPVVAKGITHADDAESCVQAGAAAIVVSAHGGRNLDTAPAPIEVLPEIVDQVAGRAEVLVDGGVRRGTDIVKAIALGARAVLVGRPIFWGLAAGGADGLGGLLDILQAELRVAMALCGRPTVGSIGPDSVALESPLTVYARESGLAAPSAHQPADRPRGRHQ
ncbi:MAG: 4-hydroxymandelate oxidase [Pseudonocardiales bacterium]|jgi:4-hydroxymandelate oxidase|nr:4-hydroxymandelate oxidase [Pseudonocardiales bacterium]